MKPSEEVKHLPSLFRQLVDNESKLRLVERIRERLISILKPITPPKAKLKNFDYAADFCRESLKNQENKLYENALTLLKICNDALESGKVEQHHINAILVLYGKADQAREEQKLISEDRKEIAPLVKLGKEKLKQLHAPKVKKDKVVLKHCKELMLKKPSPSAEGLMKRFPKKEISILIEGTTIYRELTESGEEKIFCISPIGKTKTIGTRAFAGYYKDIKINLNIYEKRGRKIKKV